MRSSWIRLAVVGLVVEGDDRHPLHEGEIEVGVREASDLHSAATPHERQGDDGQEATLGALQAFRLLGAVHHFHIHSQLM